MPNELVPKPGTLSGAKKIKVTGLHARVMENGAKAAMAQESAETMPNRLALLLDCSGSMASPDGSAEPKIELLRQAVLAFIRDTDFGNTSEDIMEFPPAYSANDGWLSPLTCDANVLTMTANALAAGGDTPMGRVMEEAMTSLSLTRAVIISDGNATDSVESPTAKYKESGIPVDCIHIGSSRDGEALLKRIAEATGGVYMKLVDVAKLSHALKYLQPHYRAMLMSPEAKEITGADEVKIK